MRRLAHYFGRRGGVLILFGTVWLAVGTSFALVPATNRFSATGDSGPLTFADSRPWPGIFWLACGIIALVNGLIRRKVSNEDAIGFTALGLPAVVWTVLYGWSTIAWLVWRIAHDPPPPYGRPQAFLGMVLFAVLAAAVTVISGWKDDLDLPTSALGTPTPSVVSEELALLDRLVETKQENTDRGTAAREASEEWIWHARIESERHIAESATENDRLIALEEELHPPDGEGR